MELGVKLDVKLDVWERRSKTKLRMQRNKKVVVIWVYYRVNGVHRGPRATSICRRRSAQNFRNPDQGVDDDPPPR